MSDGVRVRDACPKVVEMLYEHIRHVSSASHRFQLSTGVCEVLDTKVRP